MCGIVGIVGARPDALQRVRTMTASLRHRGPDGHATWASADGTVALGHARLAIIDLDHRRSADDRSPAASSSPTTARSTTTSSCATSSAARPSAPARIPRSFFAPTRSGASAASSTCVACSRSRFGIRATGGCSSPAIGSASSRSTTRTRSDGFYVASEVKALLPYLPGVETDIDGLHDYLSFQFCLGDKTMFAGVKQLRPAHFGWVERDGRLQHAPVLGGAIPPRLDRTTKRGSSSEVRAALGDSIRVHLRSDVEVGAYLSGGVDSSLMAALAREALPGARIQGFHGKFSGWRHVRRIALCARAGGGSAGWCSTKSRSPRRIS